MDKNFNLRVLNYLSMLYIRLLDVKTPWRWYKKGRSMYEFWRIACENIYNFNVWRSCLFA